MDLKGRTVVGVGSASGIGQAIDLGPVNSGADVVASSRRPEQVRAVATEIEAVDRQALSITADVNDKPSGEYLRSAALDALGKVDILVNSAGWIKRGPTINASESDWQEVLDTNLIGVLRSRQIFGRHILQRGYGRII